MPRHHAPTSRLNEAKRLRRLRQYLQVSQRDLAHEFKVGHGAVSFWESGRRTIPGPILKLIEIYEKELGIKGEPEDEFPSLLQIDSSWISRNFKLSSVMAQIAARLAGNSLQKLMGTEVEPFSETIAQKLGDAFGDLKGLMMKVGQMMSYTDFGLPDVAREKLIPLQDRSMPLESKLIELKFAHELKTSPQAAFAKWNPSPVGVGSIGQVHRASLHEGLEVAVKIQFPEISTSIDSDLKNTKFAEVLFPLLLRKQDSVDVLSELKDKFIEECDYTREAKSLIEFSVHFQQDAKIVIPKVVPAWSTEHVLTTEYLKGQRFAEFLHSSTQADKNEAGANIFRMAFQSAFQHGILNCDPNPGNYIFLPDGKIGFIDFGCVKHFEPEFTALWKDYLLAFLDNDLAKAKRVIIEMGYVPRPSTFDFAAHAELMKQIYKPWLVPGEFEFNRDYVIELGKKITIDNPNRSKINLPRDWVFVNRLQWGLYSVLATLEAKADFRAIMLKIVGR